MTLIMGSPEALKIAHADRVLDRQYVCPDCGGDGTCDAEPKAYCFCCNLCGGTGLVTGRRLQSQRSLSVQEIEDAIWW